MSELLPVEDALAIIAAQTQPLGSERLALRAAFGRYLAEPVIAPLDLPPFTNSAMDGFAVKAQDTPGKLTIIGESAAGHPFSGILGPGQAVQISTGAVMPQGADAVVIIEQASVSDDSLLVPDTAAIDKHVRHAGSDVRAGDAVLPAGTRIASVQIGAVAAAGVDTISCGVRPSVALIPTGTELTPVGQPLAPGGIYDSNGPMLTSLITQAGGIPAVIRAPTDHADSVRHAFAQSLHHDVVITTGGVSVGPHDLVRQVSSEIGIGELFWGIKMRPGKPLTFGVHGRTLVFGLPGNPVSALVCFEIFIRPALLMMQGASDAGAALQTRLLSSAVPQNPERDDLIRVSLDEHGHVSPLRGQMSHQMTVSAQADCLARIPAGENVLPAGSPVSYLPLRG